MYALQAWSVLEARDLYPDLPFEFWGDNSMIEILRKTKLFSLYTSVHLLPEKEYIDTGLFWAIDKMRLCGEGIIMLDTDAILHTEIDTTRLVTAHMEHNIYMPYTHYTPKGYVWPEWYSHDSAMMVNTSLLYFPDRAIWREWLANALAYAGAVTHDLQHGNEFIRIEHPQWELMCLVEQKFLYDLAIGKGYQIQYAKDIPMPGGQKPYSHIGYTKVLMRQAGPAVEKQYFEEKILGNLFNLRPQYLGRVMDIEKRAR